MCILKGCRWQNVRSSVSASSVRASSGPVGPPSSWLADLEVVATDPAPGAEGRLRGDIASAWPMLDRMGLAHGADPTRVRFMATVEDCVAEADFVQENGPEREEIKRDTYRRMDAVASADVILASSTSSFRPSLLQRGCRHPERVLVGHPFNPPHLVPLVEIVGGETTSEAAIDRATSFYKSLGKIHHPSSQRAAWPCRQSTSGSSLARGVSPGRHRGGDGD